MLPTLKAEFRKLITVRSTYIMVALGLLLVGFMAFWIEGYKGIAGSPASSGAPEALKTIVGQSAGVGAVFTMIIAILFTGHEYRYNTIMYTLTANVHRTQVLVTKLLTVTLFSIFLGTIFIAAGIVTYLLGLSLRDVPLQSQEINVLQLAGKVAFYFLGYALLATLAAVISRSVIAAVSFMLVFPSMVEPLLSLLLKGNAKYLPFASLDSVMGATGIPNPLSSGKAMIVSSIYLLIGFVVTWFLFSKRDAN